MKRRKTAAILLVLTAASLAFGQKAEPEVFLREKRIIDPSAEGLTLVFRLALRNETAGDVRLARYDYRAIIDDTEYLNLAVPLDDPIRIAAGAEILIALPIKLNYVHLFPAVPALKEKDIALCTIAGGMTFQDERGRSRRVPIAFSGDFPVYRGLDIVPVPIETKSLTIGGAELTVGFAVRGPGGFAFTIDRLAYTLDLGSFRALQGETGAGARVGARGEKIFTFPLIIDFFEAGDAVYEGLEKDALDVRISGRLEMTTPWGPWSIPFENTVKTPVRK